MRTAKVVIGAGFGDEGKGKMVAGYVAPRTTVVRYCGGGNAGHTVVHNGYRHVFHHFGSGTLHGAATYLSRYFVSNPILFFQELALLHARDLHPIVLVDPASEMTTPFDMMLNQMVEQARGGARHGSCGVGLNETIKRSEAGFALVAADLGRASTLREILHGIRDQWVPARLAALDIIVSTEWRQRLASEAILERFISQCVAYHRQVGEFDWTGEIVFEGAQGLLLDQDHHFFPYVTHAHTGLRNVVRLATAAGLDALEVSYVTRAYATRHGAGPFPREVAGLHYADSTNITNDWQGALRFGHLDLDLMAEAICNDLRTATLPVTHGLGVTCLDQLASVVFWQDGERRAVPSDAFARLACAAIGGAFCLSSDGVEAGFVEH